jgi:hypothetical protein
MAQPPAYTISTDFSQDESNGVSGRSTVGTAALDSELANISTFITTMRANIAIIQADDGTIKDDAVDLPALGTDVLNYITTNGSGWYASCSGAVNTLSVTLNPAPTSLTNGMFVVTDINLTNTSTAVTMNVNGLGAKTIVTDGAGTTPSVGALTIGTFYGFQYDSSADKFQIVFSGDSLTHSANASNSATASASSATDANTAKLAAEAALDAFTDQYLGSFAFASLPSVDGDGDPLTDGDLAYDTTNNVLRVYDLATTAWLQTVPSASDQTNIDAVASNSTNINLVAGKATEIGVLGASAVIDDMDILGTSANVTAMSTVATNVASVNSFANRYRVSSTEPSADLDAGDLYFNTSTNELRSYGTMWQATAPSAAVQASINIVAGDVVYSEDLGSIADAITTSSGNGDITTVADAIANVNALAATEVIADMAILGTSVAVADMAILGEASVVADMAILGEASVVEDLSILGLAGVVEDLDILATPANVTAMSTVSTSIASVNSFANQYTIASSAPGSPSEGDLWYDNVNNLLKYYNGSSFVTLAPGIADLVSDGSPQLGGALDGQDNNFTNCGTVSGDNLQIDFGSIV